MGLMGILALVAVILIGGTYVGVSFSDLLQDAKAFVDEQAEKKNDASDPDVKDNGNFAEDTGTRVCDLEVTFVGFINNFDLYKWKIEPDVLFGEGTFLFMGDHGADIFGIFPVAENTNKNIIEYQWYCKGEIGTNASWLANVGVNNLVKGSIFDKTKGETIRIKFEAITDSGKKMFDKSGKVQFQNTQTLSTGKDYPIALTLSVYLEEVTEDDYEIRFWSDTSRIAVSSEPAELGAVFKYNLLKPTQ